MPIVKSPQSPLLSRAWAFLVVVAGEQQSALWDVAVEDARKPRATRIPRAGIWGLAQTLNVR